MFKFEELTQAADELGVDLVFAFGGCSMPDSQKWITKDRGLAVVARKDGQTDRIIARFTVTKSGPTVPPQGYTGHGPRLMPDGEAGFVRWMLMNRMETEVVGA